MRELSQKTISFSPSQSMSQLVIVKVVRHKYTYTRSAYSVWFYVKTKTSVRFYVHVNEKVVCWTRKKRCLSHVFMEMCWHVFVCLSLFLARTFHNSNSIIWLSNTCLFCIRGGKIRVNPLCLDIFTSNPRDVLLD